MKIRTNTLNKRRPQREDRAGATAVEFAFVFPVILVFFIGIVAITQAFLVRDMTQLAAYECARQGTLFDATTADVEAKAAEVIQAMGLQGHTVELIPNEITNSTQEITVTISVPLHENAWVTGSFLPQTWDIASSVTLRKIDDR